MNANKKAKEPDTKGAGSKKEKDGRPKSSDKLKKRKEGTPEKAVTPGPEENGSTDSRPFVLDDEEIQSLAIKPDDLIQIRQDVMAVDASACQAKKPVRPVNVRKISSNPPPRRITKCITVAKGAPPRAPLKPAETEGKSGPRFDDNGNVIAHSLLGTLEEFKQGAENKGELAVDYYIRDQDRVQTPTTLTEDQKPVLVKAETMRQPVGESVDKSNALINWQNKMRERKLQQGYISRLLQKPLEELVMNQSDTFREKQELRYLIDRSIPAVDYGKGYRVGSEFWHQQLPIGDEMRGLHMTRNQTERGYPPPIEHVRISTNIRKEKGMPLHRPDSAQNKPWHRSNFLRERISELRPVMQDLDPHQPAADELMVVGSNNPYDRYIRAATPISERADTGSLLDGDICENEDPLANHPDVYTLPVFGPSIKFAGQVLQWTGDSHSCCDQIAVDARVTFEAYTSFRSTSILEIINLGTTAMYFSWKMLPKSNPFDLVNAKVQRFYFNTSSGVILPGDTLKFPFVFKSDKAGVFSEQWQFQTHPVVAGGAALVVTLRGVALREDKMKKQRELIENKLQKNIIWKNMRRMIDDIVDSINAPDRPRSPVDSYLTEQEVFQRQNPQLYYKHEVVNRLRDLYKMLVSPPTMDGGEEEYNDGDSEIHLQDAAPVWNLNVTQFKHDVLNLEEEDERKPAYLENINDAVMQLSFPYCDPRLQKMYKSCYHSLSNTLDSLSGHSIYLRNLLGLPERETEDRLEDLSRDEFSMSPTSSYSRRFSHQLPVKVHSAGRKRLSVDSACSPAPGGKTAVVKTTPKTGAKEEKKSGKVDPKKEAKGKDTPKKGADRASPVKKTPPVKSGGAAGATLTPAHGNEGRITPAVTERAASPSPSLKTDMRQEMKYKEKLTAQAYMEMNRLVLSLVDAFEEIYSTET